MKSDEEIGRYITTLIWTDPSVMRDQYAAKIGAAARKAVGQPPKVQIEGMSVEEIQNEMVLDLIKQDADPSSFLCAQSAYRLANTVAEPEFDPDAFVKEIWERWETARLNGLHAGGPLDPIPFDQAYPWEQAACRAVAKFLEEKK